MSDTIESPVVFEPRAGGRDAALLNQVVVGWVWPGVHVPFFWSTSLPDATFGSHSASSREEARRALERRASLWIEAAGLAPARSADGEIRAWRDGDEIKRAART